MSDPPFHRKWGLLGFLGLPFTCQLWGQESHLGLDAAL